MVEADLNFMSLLGLSDVDTNSTDPTISNEENRDEFNSEIDINLYSTLFEVNKNIEIFDDIVSNSFPKSYFRDTPSCIVINGFLSLHLKLQNGDLVKLFVNRNTRINEKNSSNRDAGSEIPNESHHFAIVVVSDKFDEQLENETSKNIVHIHPLMWFNLRKPCYNYPSKHITELKLGCRNSPEFKLKNVPYASKVIVSLIQSPSSQLPRTAYDALLKQYFSTTRLLEEGDVFVLSTNDDETLQCQSSIFDGSGNIETSIHFKVVSITSDSIHSCSLVHVDHTSLFQIADTNSFVPIPPVPSFFDHDDLLSAWQDVEDTSDEMMIFEAIQPFVQHKNLHLSIPPSFLLVSCLGSGVPLLCRALACRHNMHSYHIKCDLLDNQSVSVLEMKLKQIFQSIPKYLPCMVIFENIDSFSCDKDGNEDRRTASTFNQCLNELMSKSYDWPVIVMATTTSLVKVSLDLQKSFMKIFTFNLPTQRLRLNFLKFFMKDIVVSEDVDQLTLSSRTGGFTFNDLNVLINLSKEQAFMRTRSRNTGESVVNGVQLRNADIENAFNQLRKFNINSLNAPKIPNVTWADVGGLDDVKRDVIDTIQLPLKYPQLIDAGLRRSGILLFGPPGTGKTLMAKAIANECSLNFMSVKGPELLNMYVGQSEENIREVFKNARQSSPCVIFFDELDSLAPNRGRTGDSGGVMDRVVSQLLAELDGMTKSSDLFVIGATNRPDLIDPALLRPGRFDKMLYLGVDGSKETQLKIIKALTNKFKLADGTSMERIVGRCSDRMTGADFYALCSDALMCATRRIIQYIEANQISLDENSDIIVTEDDFNEALHNFKPSLTEKEFQRYEQLKQQFCSFDKTFTR